MSEEGDSSDQRVGNEDELVDPNKAKHKIIRVLTVIAYALSVSMAAILLSIYYVFMWDGHPTLARKDPSPNYQQVQNRQHNQQPTLPTSATTVLPLTAPASDELLMRGEIFDNNLEQPNDTTNEEMTEENILIDVPYEPTAIPVVEAKTEAPPPSSPEPQLEETINDPDDWPQLYTNNTDTQLSKLTKRSPMLKKLIASSIMD